MLTSKNRQEFTFGTWAAKIRLPYGQGIWPAWWMVGNDDKDKIWWPTAGEIDTLEMIGGNKRASLTDQNAHGTIHWNNESNTMNPVNNKQILAVWTTPDGSMLHNNSLVYWTEWALPPDNTTVWPQHMIIDWVRVYQQKKSVITHEI